MFRGFSSVSIDAKGRMAIPARFREQLTQRGTNQLVVTLNPWDKCLWLYPLPEWQAVDAKLQQLSDFDKQSRRTKQVIRGYANDCVCDGQGRVLLPQELRDFAGLDKRAVVLGQGNKFEIWEEGLWAAQRDEWLQGVGAEDAPASPILGSLSL